MKHLNPLRGFPEVAKFGSRIQREEMAWRALVRRIAEIKSLPELSRMLALYISRPERRKIVRRALAYALLSEGKSYRAIGEELWLSPQSISAIKKSFRERQYRSRRARGGKKRVYTIEKSRGTIRMGHYRRTKYGPVLW